MIWWWWMTWFVFSSLYCNKYHYNNYCILFFEVFILSCCCYRHTMKEMFTTNMADKDNKYDRWLQLKTQPTNQTLPFRTHACKFLVLNGAALCLVQITCARICDTCSSNLCKILILVLGTRFLSMLWPYESHVISLFLLVYFCQSVYDSIYIHVFCVSGPFSCLNWWSQKDVVCNKHTAWFVYRQDPSLIPQ